MVDYQYYEIDLYGKYFANLPNTVGVLANGKTMVLWRENKLWYLTKSYDTIPKTQTLNGWNAADRAKNPNQSIYRKLWNFDLLWKKNYGTLEKSMVI